MILTTGLEINQNAGMAFKEKKFSKGQVMAMLFSRTALFLIFQSLFFIGFLAVKAESPWRQAADWWPFSVTFANIVCIFLMDSLLKRENKRYTEFFRITKGSVIKDILMTLGLLGISMPVAFFPNFALGSLLFDNYMQAADMLLRPLPLWAAWAALIVFPLTIGMAELPVYFGYVMPRLEAITRNKWAALVIPALVLSLQHIAIPLLFDARFILWRLFMFLPFAFIIGLIIRWKPRLFPYILVGHFLMDIMTAVSILMVSM